MKVQLITPKHSEGGCATNKPRPPIGLELIAASLEHDFCQDNNKIEIEILDGEIVARDKLVSLIGADWVGFSCIFSNHRECLDLAATAKDRGAKVVFGGPNATHLAQRILRNHPFIDFVVVGDGEIALTQLFKGADPLLVPNLVFRHQNAIITTHTQILDVNTIPLFDLEHLYARERYFDSSEPFPICCIRGCQKAITVGRCQYCTIPYKGLRVLDAESVWEQIQLLQNNYGIKRFFEAGDSFLVELSCNQGLYNDNSILYPELLLRARPSNMSASFRVYERPDTIDEASVRLLKNLGVDEMFIGFEHIDEKLKNRARRPLLCEDIWKKLEILEEYDIKVILAMMYGLPGESHESAMQNSDFILKTAERFQNVTKFFISITMPLFGSYLFNKISHNRKLEAEYNSYGHSLAKDDVFDYNLLTHLMVRECCNISPKELARIVEDTRHSLSPDRMATFGNAKLL